MKNKNLKACILAAGIGTRLAPLTETRPKPIIPIAGKPLLQHTIENLKENGILDILLIVGYRKKQIEKLFGDGKKYGVKISYIEQKEFLVTGHATNLAKKFADGSPFLLIYGDLFMDKVIYDKTIELFLNNNYNGIITAKKVKDPTKFGILEASHEGNLLKIIEKPADNSFGNLANAGVYIFTSEIFQAIKDTKKSPRGEFELTDSIEICVSKGSKFQILDISEHYWSDIGHPWNLLDATKHVISKLPGDPTTKTNYSPANIINKGAIIENFVTIHGTVVIGKNSRIKSGTYLEGPLLIGENCTIGPNSYLRPYTSIGNNCKIGNASEVKASVIMDNTAIPHLSYVGDSIIGENVNFGCGSITANLRLDKKNIIVNIKNKKIDSKRRKFGTVIGDHAQLGIQVSIMPGKKIGSFSRIGSNAVVTKDIPANSIFYKEQSEKLKENN